MEVKKRLLNSEEEDLVHSINNYLKNGQIELARALVGYCVVNGLHSYENILEAYIESSESLDSVEASHIAWCCLEMMQATGKVDLLEKNPGLRNNLKFGVLCGALGGVLGRFKGISGESVDNLRFAYRNKSSFIPNSAAFEIRNLITKMVFSISEVLRLLWEVSKRSGEVEFDEEKYLKEKDKGISLPTLSVDSGELIMDKGGNLHVLDLLSILVQDKLLKERNAELGGELLRLLVELAGTTEGASLEDKQKAIDAVRDVLLAIAETLQMRKEQWKKEQLYDLKRRVYEAVSMNRRFLKHFLRAEDEYFAEFISEKESSDVDMEIPPPFQCFKGMRRLQRSCCDSTRGTWSSQTQHQSFFKKLDTEKRGFLENYFTSLRLNKEHALEYPLLLAHRFLLDRDFDKAYEVLLPFPDIAPIVVFMVFDKYENDFEARAGLLELLDDLIFVNSSFRSDSLRKVSEQFRFQQQLVIWISTAFELDAEDILKRLCSKSAIYVLKDLMAEIVMKRRYESTLIEILRSEPAAESDRDVDISLILSFRFLSVILSILKGEEEATGDGKNILKCGIYHKQRELAGGSRVYSDVSVDEMKETLNSIPIESARVGLLECAMSLLFLKKGGIENSEGNENDDSEGKSASVKLFRTTAPDSQIGGDEVEGRWRATYESTLFVLRLLSELAGELIDPPERSAVKTETKTEEVNDLDLSTDLQTRLRRIVEFVNILNSRLNIIQDLFARTKVYDTLPECEIFMAFLFAPPEDLFEHAISFDMFSVAMEIIEKENLPLQSSVEGATLLMKTQKWLFQLSSEDISTDETLNAAVDRVKSEVEKIVKLSGDVTGTKNTILDTERLVDAKKRIYIDILIGSNPPSALVLKLLEEQFREEEVPIESVGEEEGLVGSETIPKKEEKGFTEGLNGMIDTLVRSIVEIKQLRSRSENPLGELLKTLVIYELDVCLLDKKDESLVLLDELQRMIDDSRRGNEESRKNQRKFLLDFVESFAKGSSESNKETSTKEKKETHLGDFVSFLVEIGDIVRFGVPEDEYDYLRLLLVNPMELINTVIFEHEAMEEAEKLSQLLNVDLLSAVLFSAAGDAGDTGKVALGNSKNREISPDILKWIAKQSQVIAAIAILIRNDILTKQLVGTALGLLPENSVLTTFFDIKEKVAGKIRDLPASSMETPQHVDVETNRSDEEDTENNEDVDRFSELYSIISSDFGVTSELNWYSKYADQLVKEGQFKLALKVMDIAFPEGPPDFLLTYLVEGAEDKMEIPPLLKRFKDKTSVPPRMILKYMDHWDIDTAIDACASVVNSLSEGNEHYEGIKRHHMMLMLFKKIQAELEVSNWQELHEKSLRDPVDLVRQLKDRGRYDMARRVIEIFERSDMEVELTVANLYSLMTERKDHIDAILLLEQLASEISGAAIVFKVVKEVIVLLKQDFSKKIFLLDFVLALETNETLADEEEMVMFIRRRKGLMIMSCLSTEWVNRLEHLELYPNLIVESLILNAETTELASIFATCPEYLEDAILLKYAEAALHLDATRYFSSNEISVSIETFLVLSGNKMRDTAMRKDHSFHSAPDISLAKALLNLVKSHKDSGMKCIEIYAKLAKELRTDNFEGGKKKVKSSLYSTLEFMSLIKEILRYARMRLSQSMEDCLDGIQRCEKYISRVEILEEILKEECKIQLSLEDFNDPHKARKLRDALIRDEKLNLALNIARKCNVETFPVFHSWGIRLVRISMYKEAREKFSHCNLKDNEQYLFEIISILEYSPPIGRDVLQDALRDFQMIEKEVTSTGGDPQKTARDYWSKKAKANEIPGISFMTNAHLKDETRLSSLSPERFQECIFYISTYSTPKNVVSFYLKHRMLEDAMVHVMTSGIPQMQFLETVADYCLRNNMLSKLQEIVKRKDPTLKRSHNYLYSLCKVLDQKAMFRALYTFQVMMEDDIKAGITCIRLFLNGNLSLEGKIRELKRAKTHFESALEASQVDIGVRKERGDAMVYVSKVNLQLEITEVLGEKYPKIHVFGSEEQLAEVAEDVVLIHKLDLAYRIVSIFRLSILDVYTNAAVKMTRAKEIKLIDEMLSHLKDISDEEVVDKIVLRCIDVAGIEMKSPKLAERFLGHLNVFYLDAYFVSRKLNAAYLHCARNGMVDEVKTIYSKALELNQKKTADVCLKYLKKNSIQKM